MPKLLEALKIFENSMKLKNPHLMSLFKPGVSAEYTNDISKQIGLYFTDELATLYNWRNGIALDEKYTVGQLEIFSGGIQLAVEDAITCYNYFRKTNKSIIRQKLFPVFSNGGGDFVLIDLNEKSEEFSMLKYYTPSYTEYDMQIITIYDSLTDLFKTINSCLDTKAFQYLSDEHIFEVDSILEYKISKLDNPRSLFWKVNEQPTKSKF